MQTPTPEQWRKIKALFAEALEHAPGEREALIKGTTDDALVLGELRRMLAHHDDAAKSAFLGQSDLAGMAARLVAEEDVFDRGQPVGQFVILEEIGRGGMGVVYRARQSRPARDVALKVIRPQVATPTLLRRFELESELLARLNHPGIAQIYESGLVEVKGVSTPYFAMELVDGVPITAFTKARDSSIAECLEIIAKVCDAAHHAHQKSIIHRDLKPNNVLVDESGRPRIIDFGVAGELVAQPMRTLHTTPGELLGTLVYMSPEQLATSASTPDTRSDIYALGVIAYELLCGQSPYDLKSSSILESIRIIEQFSPELLGQRDRRLRGDIETVVGKAMARERSRRYGAASEFAADLRRCISHDPVQARKPSVLYQARLFAMRNRALVAGLCGIALVMVLGIAGITWQWQQTQRQVTMRDQAFRLLVRASTGRTVSSERKDREDLNALARWLLDKPTTEPGQTKWLSDRIAERLTGHGDLDAAAKMYGLGYELSREDEQQPEGVVFRAAELYAEGLRRAGDPWRAFPLAEKEALRYGGLIVFGKVDPAGVKNALIRLNKLRLVQAMAMHDLGQITEGELLLRELLEIFKELEKTSPADEQWDVLDTKVALARLLISKGEGSAHEGLVLLEDVYATKEPRLEEGSGPDSPILAPIRLSMAEAYLAMGEAERAEELIWISRPVYIKYKRPGHPSMLSLENKLGRAMYGQGDFEGGEPVLRGVVESFDKEHPQHWQRWVYHTDLARCLIALGRLEEAREHLIDAREGLGVFDSKDHRRQEVDRLLAMVTEQPVNP